MFRPKGNQPPLDIIFGGSEKRISKDEKMAWLPDVKDFFQQNAWMDSTVNMEWAEKHCLNLSTMKNLKSTSYFVTI